jgi:hypothetical protein
MLSKLCVLCLFKYVRLLFTRNGLSRLYRLHNRIKNTYKTCLCAILQLRSSNNAAHNYINIHIAVYPKKNRTATGSRQRTAVSRL